MFAWESCWIKASINLCRGAVFSIFIFMSLTSQYLPVEFFRQGNIQTVLVASELPFEVTLRVILAEGVWQIGTFRNCQKKIRLIFRYQVSPDLLVQFLPLISLPKSSHIWEWNPSKKLFRWSLTTNLLVWELSISAIVKVSCRLTNSNPSVTKLFLSSIEVSMQTSTFTWTSFAKSFLWIFVWKSYLAKTQNVLSYMIHLDNQTQIFHQVLVRFFQTTSLLIILHLLSEVARKIVCSTPATESS